MEFCKTLGIGPFVPRFRPPIRDMRQDGNPIKPQEMKIMFAYFNNAELELIQPIGDGPWMDFLKQTGGGIQHLGFWVDDLDKTLSDLEKKGIKAKIIGRREKNIGGGMAYLDTLKYCGILIEIGETPAIYAPVMPKTN